VITGCMATEFVWMVSAVMLAFPAPASCRAGGILMASIFLAGLNLLRVVSLYLVGVHFPGSFTPAHEELWPAILVVGTLSILVAWFRWLMSKGHV
jgi:exosortase/archaeosortase family protein